MYIPKNVLVIDDDPILCEICKSHLQSIGVPRVETASNGNQALALLNVAGSHPDLVICDLNMPQLDGVQFLSKLRAKGFTGHVAIVSGEDRSVIATARSLAQTIGLKIAGVVKKPMRRDALDEILQACGETPTVRTAIELRVDAQEIADAIAGKQFVPYYQPLADVATGTITGVEALARWLHPEHGVVGPDQFIPQAEQLDMIDGLTNCLLQICLADLKAWHDDGMGLSLAVNLTATSLDDDTLPDSLAAEFAKNGLDPGLLTLEITERVVLEPSPRALEVLARLRIKGFGLAIDDFGAGFSNIEQLRQFPYSKLKVDRAYVTGATQDRFASAALKASVMLARELNMKTVAEGIETATDWRFVAANRVDEAQGYWLSHPLPADKFVAWHREHGGRVPQEQWRDVCSPTLGQSPVQHQPAPSAPTLNSRLVPGD